MSVLRVPARRHQAHQGTDAPSPPGRLPSAILDAISSRYLTTFIVTLAVLALREPEVLARPFFWADDAVLYTKALAEGPASVFSPYAGYLLVGHRAVVVLESIVSPALAPLLGNAVALVALAAAVATAVHPRMPWDRRTGFAIAVGIAALPIETVIGNLAHVQWPIALWVAFTALSSEPTTVLYKRAESVGLFVAGVSGPGALFLWPLFIKGPKYRLVAVLGAAAVQLVVLLVTSQWTPGTPEWSVLPVVVVVRALFLSLVGPKIGQAIGLPLLYLAGCTTAVLVGFLLVRAQPAIRAWVGYPLVATPAAAVGLRADDSAAYLDPAFASRYFWLPAVALLVLLVNERRQLLAAPLIGALLLGMATEYRLFPPYSPDWATQSSCIGDPSPCDIAVAPIGDGWYVQWRP